MSVSLERHSNLRPFTYTVHISEVDGRVLRITAGCRKWLSFDIAREHYHGEDYHGEGPYAPSRWTDKYINSLNEQMKFKLRAYQWEARVILLRLEEAARVHGERIRARRLRKKHARS